MKCENGCNDGCFDESIELQQGPTGATGAAGADGSDGNDGSDGISILYQNLSINSPSTINNTYSDAINFSVPANTLVSVGDTLRLEIVVQNDDININATIASGVSFSTKILFGGSLVDEVLSGSSSYPSSNGTLIILDLVVTATNTLSIRVVDYIALLGSRTDQMSFKTESFGFIGTFRIPPVDISGSTISSITPTLTNSNNIQVQLKNSSNFSTDIASVTSMTVYKMKKA